MAYASTTHVAIGNAGFASAITALVARVARYRLYRRTIAELSSLTNRERADIGFSGQSPQVAAYEAVYGAHG